MKKIIAVAIVILLIQKWGVIGEVFTPSLDYSLASNKEVVLYATSWCGYCAKARKFLSKNGVTYQEFDIEKSEVGKEQYNKLGGGGVPILLINGEIVRGYDLNRIIDLLNRA